MEEFQQARWAVPLVFELGQSGRKGYSIPRLDEKVKSRVGNLVDLIPQNLLREKRANLPEISEVEVARHFTALSQMNFGIDNGFYPLGSCTMKYNPKVNDALASRDESRWIHPLQPEETMQGTLEIMYKLSSWLAEITGTSRVSLQPFAGAQGEFTGALIIRAYHKKNGEESRNEIIIPDSAHGTNPASAAMAGFTVVIVPTEENGCVSIDALNSVVSARTAGLMLTNPNTLGIFENKIIEIARIIHESGGLLYYDGANLNAILGKTRPGDMGFDLVHLNLHKTFSTPHGGGGPGSGPIGVREPLVEFLPVPLIKFDGKRYCLDYDIPHTIGKVGSYYGSTEVLIKAFAYILTMGSEGLNTVSDIAVLNANYLAQKLLRLRGFDRPYGKGKPVKHEFVLSCSRLKSETDVSARDIAKRLLDYGIHPPTIYFPPIVKEALMIEPTETEPFENLDKFAEILTMISTEAYDRKEQIHDAPRRTAVGKIDEIRASHPKTMCLSWKMYKKRLSEK